MLLTHAVIDGECDFVDLFRNLLPGGHVAVMSTPTELPDKGLALRLAGFEVRDTVAHITTGIEWGVLARKPLEGTVASNVLRHGVGGLNIDACRVGTEGGGTHCGNRDRDGKCLGHSDAGRSQSGATFHADESNAPTGRFPANVVLDEHAAQEMDRQSGVLKTGGYPEGGVPRTHNGIYGKPSAKGDAKFGASEGGASRFFHTMTRNQFKQHMQQLIDPDFKALSKDE